MAAFFEHFNFVVVIVLMMTGLFVVFATQNMIKKLVGLSVFQTSVFLLYISLSKVSGAQPPIIAKKDLYGASYGTGGGYDSASSSVPDSTYQAAEVLYSNPLPHVLILTAIVVGVATLAIGLALVVRVREVYGTIEDDEINKIDYNINLEGVAK